jgi:hypothetical protein
MHAKLAQTNKDSDLLAFSKLDRGIEIDSSVRPVVLEDKETIVSLKSMPKVRDKIQTLKQYVKPFQLKKIEKRSSSVMFDDSEQRFPALQTGSFVIGQPDTRNLNITSNTYLNNTSSAAFVDLKDQSQLSLTRNLPFGRTRHSLFSHDSNISESGAKTGIGFYS